MITPDFIIEHARALPWKTLLMGGVFTATSLSAFFSWRIAKYVKDIAMTFNLNGDTGVTDEVSASEETKDELACGNSPVVWHFDGATRLGKVRTENQDTFVVWRESQTSGFVAVFDGAGGVAGGREAAQSAADICQAVIQDTSGGDLTPDERLSLAIETARQSADLNGLTGLTTAILAYVDGDTLTYATLGDGALAMVWPDGMISQTLVPHHILGQPDNIIAGYIGQGCTVPPRTGMMVLEIGTTLMLMSDGASDLFPYQDFAEKRDVFGAHLANGSDPTLANHFLTLIEEARDPDTDAYLHHDNMTLVLARLSKGPEDILLLTDHAEDKPHA